MLIAFVLSCLALLAGAVICWITGLRVAFQFVLILTRAALIALRILSLLVLWILSSLAALLTGVPVLV